MRYTHPWAFHVTLSLNPSPRGRDLLSPHSSEENRRFANAKLEIPYEYFNAAKLRTIRLWLTNALWTMPLFKMRIIRGLKQRRVDIVVYGAKIGMIRAQKKALKHRPPPHLSRVRGIRAVIFR